MKRYAMLEGSMTSKPNTHVAAAHIEVPARLEDAALERIRTITIKASRVIDAKGLCRVDIFVRADGTVVVNEINPMPGFTPISMYPKARQATGVGYTKLVSRLINAALAHGAIRECPISSFWTSPFSKWCTQLGDRKNGGKISRWYFSEERGVRVVLKVVLSIRKTCYGVGKAGFSQGFEGKLPAFGGVVSCGVAPYWCRVSGGL